MAGKGQRFLDAGYLAIKPLLDMGDDTVIERVVRSIPIQCRLITIGSRQYAKDLFPTLNTACGDQFDWGYFFCWIDNSMGPLDTLLKARKHYNYPEDLLIVYCDVVAPRPFVENFVETARQSGCPSAAVVFKSDNPRFGIIHEDHRGNTVVSGIFWFRNAQEFLKKAQEVNGNEIGVPSVLESPYLFLAILGKDFLDVGTPEDYERFKML